MHIEELREYCLSKPGVTEGFPFGADALVFKVMGKMFAVSGLDRIPPQINLKSEPEKAIALREEYDGRILPGWHMNKVHWNTVHITELPAALVIELVDDSYNLVVASLTKKLQAELSKLQ